MVNLKLKVMSLADSAEGTKVVDDATPENLKLTTDITIAFLEKGTTSGRTSVIILLKDAEGNYHTAELTQALFDAAHRMMFGAIERFGS